MYIPRSRIFRILTEDLSHDRMTKLQVARFGAKAVESAGPAPEAPRPLRAVLGCLATLLTGPMPQTVAAVTVLVPSYAEGLAFFRDTLGFAVVEDTPLVGAKRWVVVAPPGGVGANILLAVPGDDRQRARVGDQTGGRVGIFLHTDDFDRDYRAWRARGVRFLEGPRREPYGAVVVFCDPWGGKWDLIQPNGAGAPG